MLRLEHVTYGTATNVVAAPNEVWSHILEVHFIGTQDTLLLWFLSSTWHHMIVVYMLSSNTQLIISEWAGRTFCLGICGWRWCKVWGADCDVCSPSGWHCHAVVRRGWSQSHQWYVRERVYPGGRWNASTTSQRHATKLDRSNTRKCWSLCYCAIRSASSASICPTIESGVHLFRY